MKDKHAPFSDVEVLPRGESPAEIRLVRTRPRMDLHRLAQYIESTIPQRRQLLEHAKYPSPFRVDYRPAMRLFGESLRLGWDEDLLAAVALERWWADRDVDTEPLAFRRDQALDAVDAFSRLVDHVNRELSRRDARVRLADWLWLPLEINGVKVADSPVIVLEREGDSTTEVGAISFHVSKSRPHSNEVMKQAAILLWALVCANRRRSRTTIAPKLCLVVDVFSGKMMDANRGHKRRMWQAELACDEIAAIWPEL